MGKMIIELESIWDFHIDLQQLQHTPVVNGYLLEQTIDLDLIDWLWEQGFRSIAPLYISYNALGGGATGDPTRGLTPLGSDFAGMNSPGPDGNRQFKECKGSRSTPYWKSNGGGMKWLSEIMS